MAQGLPVGWHIATSKSKNLDYYYNSALRKQYWVDKDLPLGWSHQFDAATGRKYYFFIGDKDNTITFDPLAVTEISNKRERSEEIAPSVSKKPSINEYTSETTFPSPPSFDKEYQKEGTDENHHQKSNVVKSRAERRNSLMNLLSPAPNPPVQEPSNRQAIDEDHTQAAQFYNQLQRNATSDRADSLLFHLRAENNWVKSILIQDYSKRNDVVLDLACGKGGDLLKWIRRGAKKYVGVDIAAQSLHNAVERYSGYKQRTLSTEVVLVQGDLGVMSLLTDSIDCWDSSKGWHNDIPIPRKGLFDVASMQFALHYMFGSEQRACKCFQTLYEMLREGGVFIATTVDPNSVLQQYYQSLNNTTKQNHSDSIILIQDEKKRAFCTIRLDDSTKAVLLGKGDSDQDKSHENRGPLGGSFGLRYHFTLRDEEDKDDPKGGKEAVDAPEYLIPDDLLEHVAKSHGFEIILKQNFHSFINLNIAKNRTLLERMHVLNVEGTLSDAEWTIAGLYQVLVFKKVF
uniref:mRNA cap guanine-N(7) methyltransferase n=1 Tax=Albugo laibachii Nc14 TaxID=890382 RepID=F0WYT8_9STRA|nr:mRNA cap guanineN7 methyltransferase putative [Albugo laibachii Nc14]|eukprot:CCA26647.1 mRNA cap guanineN7 methyltransferase putative [Albugo laibachii Nc14]